MANKIWDLSWLNSNQNWSPAYIILYTEKIISYRSYPIHIEWDMIVVTVFLLILNQMGFHMVQNRKENCHYDHIPFNVKGNGNIVFSFIRNSAEWAGQENKEGTTGQGNEEASPTLISLDYARDEIAVFCMSVQYCTPYGAQYCVPYSTPYCIPFCTVYCTVHS